MTKKRCAWCEKTDLYKAYHDNEWGKPVYDDATLFEFLILETFQAGLSWITILKKREHFRLAFDHFDYLKVALYSENKIQELMQNAGIIRNQLKIRAAVTNASSFIKIQEEKDCTEDQKNITIVNCGLYKFESELLLKYIPEIKNNNNQKEYYLTDILEILINNNYKIDTYLLDESDNKYILGVNNQEELKNLEIYI